MVLYQPSLTSQLLSLGGAIPVSNKVGCLNPKCVSAIDNGVYWVDNNGIYFTNNGLKVSELSEGIGLFFTDYITNPMCKYFINNGLTDFTSDNSNYELSLNNSTVSLRSEIPTTNVCGSRVINRLDSQRWLVYVELYF